MATFTAYFRTDAACAEETFEADTPEQALALARKFLSENRSDLFFEDFGSGLPVLEIEILDDDEDEVALWQDDEMLLRLAADSILAALELAVAALRIRPSFPVADTDSHAIAELGEKAIALAKPPP